MFSMGKKFMINKGPPYKLILLQINRDSVSAGLRRSIIVVDLAGGAVWQVGRGKTILSAAIEGIHLTCSPVC